MLTEHRFQYLRVLAEAFYTSIDTGNFNEDELVDVYSNPWLLKFKGKKKVRVSTQNHPRFSLWEAPLGEAHELKGRC